MKFVTFLAFSSFTLHLLLCCLYLSLWHAVNVVEPLLCQNVVDVLPIVTCVPSMVSGLGVNKLEVADR